jgi:hypothetical protein
MLKIDVEKKLDDGVFKMLSTLQELWGELDLSPSQQLSMEIQFVKISTEIVRRWGKTLEVGRTPHKTARDLEHLIIKASVELRAMLVNQDLGDYKVICRKCFRPSFFTEVHVGTKVCAHCGMILD